MDKIIGIMLLGAAITSLVMSFFNPIKVFI